MFRSRFIPPADCYNFYFEPFPFFSSENIFPGFGEYNIKVDEKHFDSPEQGETPSTWKYI